MLLEKRAQKRAPAPEAVKSLEVTEVSFPVAILAVPNASNVQAFPLLSANQPIPKRIGVLPDAVAVTTGVPAAASKK